MGSLTVNGVERPLPDSAADSPDSSLLSVLREQFGQRDARFGCGQGMCGACVVLVDGRPVTSCDLPVSAVDGAAVTTVAGLDAEDGTDAALLRAFVDEQAAQCGYCLSGILVRSAALLRGNPDPDEATVRETLARNLCRCGAQPRMLRAVLGAAAQVSRP